MYFYHYNWLSNSAISSCLNTSMFPKLANMRVEQYVFDTSSKVSLYYQNPSYGKNILVFFCWCLCLLGIHTKKRGKRHKLNILKKESKCHAFISAL